MKNLGTKIGMAATAMLLALTLSACDVTPGGRCDQEGSTAKNKNGSSYTCKQVPGGKRIWQPSGNAPVKPNRP